MLYGFLAIPQSRVYLFSLSKFLNLACPCLYQNLELVVRVNGIKRSGAMQG